MSSGYVYILVNQSMPGMFKLGRTLRDSRSRARELSTTGVPTPFEVAFELFSEHHEQLEVALHRELDDFRVSRSREFFRYPLDKAITLAQRLNGHGQLNEAQFVAEDVTAAIRIKYADLIRSEISAIRIVQVPGRVWLEVTEEKELGGYMVDQTIRRTDLAFIDDGGVPYFNHADDVQVNADKYVNHYDIYSVAMTSDLFKEEAYRDIERRFQDSNQEQE